MSSRDLNKDSVLSYGALRNAFGCLAIALPFVVRLGARYLDGIPSSESISAYYYTSMRDVFVGTLFATGVFLFFYRGAHAIDAILTNVAGAAAVGIGLLPMDPKYHTVLEARFPELYNAGCYVNHGPLGFHFAVVSIFFAAISFLAVFRFPISSNPNSPQKRKRRWVYTGCGITMVVCLIIIGVVKYRFPTASIFWPESLAIIAFGIAWLAKGQGIPGLRDKVQPVPHASALRV